MYYITEKEKNYLIKHIKNTDKKSEDEAFDLGKLLRDYGMMIMTRCITNEK